MSPLGSITHANTTRHHLIQAERRKQVCPCWENEASPRNSPQVFSGAAPRTLSADPADHQVELFLLGARGLGHRRSNFSKKCSSVKGPLWTMASRMKYNAAIMPLMRKNGRKGLRCFKHCFAETHMKHRAGQEQTPAALPVSSASTSRLGTAGQWVCSDALRAEAGE